MSSPAAIIQEAYVLFLHSLNKIDSVTGYWKWISHHAGQYTDLYRKLFIYLLSLYTFQIYCITGVQNTAQ